MKQSLLLELGADNPAQSVLLGKFRHLDLKVLLSCAAEGCSDPPAGTSLPLNVLTQRFLRSEETFAPQSLGVYVFNA